MTLALSNAGVCTGGNGGEALLLGVCSCARVAEVIPRGIALQRGRIRTAGTATARGFAGRWGVVLRSAPRATFA